jgi:hypothetical protein
VHTILEQAIAYARRGWPVLPLHSFVNGSCTCGHRECTKKHPWTEHGFNDASTDEATIHTWFELFPNANLAIATGAPSGLVVVDLDPKHGGFDSALELAKKHGEFPPTPEVATGGGGRHLYFRHPGKPTKSTSSKVAPGVDIRADGGYIVAPPSKHASGVVYEWTHSPDQVAFAELPTWLLEHVLEPAKPRKSPSPARRHHGGLSPDHYTRYVFKHEIAELSRAVEGTRNNNLNKAAFRLGQFVGAGLLARNDVEAALLDQAQGLGLSDREAESTVWSGIEAGQNDPVVLPQPNAAPKIAGAKAEPKSTSRIPDTRRPNVLMDTEEHRVVSETIAALTADTGIYQRGGILARVIRDEQPDDGVLRSPGSPTIRTLPPANLRERMTRCATFTKYNRHKEEVAAHPAAWLVNAIDARGEWPGIRPLLGVSDAPILRADGSVWQTRGYDDRSGVLFEPPPGAQFPPVHPDCTIDDADAAMMRLLEVVCDFCFEAPEHRSAWLAALLTPLARFAFSGPSPLFLIDANIRGAGKGLLAQTIGRIVLGREMPVSSYAHDSAEMRKKITAIAIAGDRLLLLDNLEGVFGNDALDRALTTTCWKDRILGKSEEVELPLIPTWYATGNNVQVAADTTRRLIHIRMDVLNERPEERTAFRHPNLLSWITKNRSSLLSDALTILAAYCRAGRPTHGLTPFGSFEGWSDLVREAVVWLGLPDPCLTRTKLAEASDTTADSLTQLMSAWRTYDSLGQGLIVSELLARLYPQDRQYAPGDEASVAMRSALENLIGCPPGRTPTTRQVGNKLRHFRRRVVGGSFIDIDRKTDHAAVWRLYAGK